MKRLVYVGFTVWFLATSASGQTAAELNCGTAPFLIYCDDFETGLNPASKCTGTNPSCPLDLLTLTDPGITKKWYPSAVLGLTGMSTFLKKDTTTGNKGLLHEILQATDYDFNRRSCSNTDDTVDLLAPSNSVGAIQTYEVRTVFRLPQPSCLNQHLIQLVPLHSDRVFTQRITKQDMALDLPTNRLRVHTTFQEVTGLSARQGASYFVNESCFSGSTWVRSRLIIETTRTALDGTTAPLCPPCSGPGPSPNCGTRNCDLTFRTKLEQWVSNAWQPLCQGTGCPTTGTCESVCSTSSINCPLTLDDIKLIFGRADSTSFHQVRIYPVVCTRNNSQVEPCKSENGVCSAPTAGRATETEKVELWATPAAPLGPLRGR